MNWFSILQMIFSLVSTIVPVVQKMSNDGATKKQMAMGAAMGLLNATPEVMAVLPTNIKDHVSSVIDLAVTLGKATGELVPNPPKVPTK